MAYNFPDAPTPGQVFEKWTWNGQAWVLTAGDFVKRAGDTMSGHLSLPTGPAAANAVRKDYVDAAVGAVDLSSKVSKSGDTMTGNLTVQADLRTYRAGGTTGVIYLSDADKYLYNNGTEFILNGGGLNVATGRLHALGGDIHAQYGPRAGTFRFGAADTDRYVTHDGSNTHWNIGGTMYLNAALANVNSLTVSGAGSFGGAVTSAGQNQFNGGFVGFSVVNSTVNYGGSSYVEIRAPTSTADPFISFHRPGSFACNFGLGNDQNMRFGGWSHGGNYWKLWSERDFTGFPLSNGRLPHAGDAAPPLDGYGDTIAHAVVASGYTSSMNYSVGGFRFRYVQGYTTGWFTFAYA